MRRIACRLFALCMAMALNACSLLPSTGERIALANELASVRQWRSVLIKASQFTLVSYVPERISQNDVLTVYIEGDGVAWIDSETPSYDPTPRQPVGLKLALAHPDEAVAYLARPCQFLGESAAKHCGVVYWTNKRFAPEVIQATSFALDELKRRYAAKQLNLVGYSGGGAVAAIVASRRSDIKMLVTVAGNLDTQAWVQHHRLAPLAGSLNPADARQGLAKTVQIHFVGGNDRIVPPTIAHSFVRDFSPDPKRRVEVLEGFNHTCCWVENWPALWRKAIKHERMQIK